MPQATSNEPPFPRGSYQVLNAGVAVGEQPFAGILGQEWEFDDLLWNTGANGPPTLRGPNKVRVRLVRNESGAAILPKNACKIDPANAGLIPSKTSSYLDQYAIADEFLPAAGVPDDAIFWVVVRGSTKALLAADILGSANAGQYLNASNVTAGTLDILDFSAAAVLPDDTTAASNYFIMLKNARARLTEAMTVTTDDGATKTFQMTE